MNSVGEFLVNCYFIFFGAKVADVYSLGVCTGLMYQNSGVPLLDLFGNSKIVMPAEAGI